MNGMMWQKSWLIPLWAIDFIWLLALLIPACMGKCICHSQHYRKITNEFKWPTGINFGAAEGSDLKIAIVCLSAISIVLDIVAIILFAKQKLHPLVFLGFQGIKTVFWFAIFIVDAHAAANAGDNGLHLLFSTPIFLCSVCQLIYGSAVTYRVRAGKVAYPAEGGVAGFTGKDSPQRGSFAGHRPDGIGAAIPLTSNPPNGPLREASPAQSGASSAAPGLKAVLPHSDVKSASAADNYCDDGGTSAERSYEMQGVAYRDS